MEFVKEFYLFLMTRKKYWLFPVILSALLLGTLIVYSKGSVMAPFIYTVF